jgi:outer membrane protein TolC
MGGGGLSLIDSVRLMLANDPNLVVAESHLLNARGALSIQKGTFDTVVGASVGYTDLRTPFLGAFSERDSALLTTTSVTQELRSGLVLIPEVDFANSTSNILPPGVTNTATVSFTLRQPLLRGRGSKAVAAAENAAKREVEASALDLRFTTAQRILAVVNQYWTAVAARLDLDILRSNEESSRQLLATTRRLIAADITPAAEAVQLEANLAAAEAARIAGESTLFKAHQDLGREIGLTGDQVAALPLPADALPAVAPEALGAAPAGTFVDAALRHRADLAAARLRQQESDILLVAAQNALLPQLDLLLKPSYIGVTGGGGVVSLFDALAGHIPGLGSTLTLSLSWPVRNDLAYGQLLQSRAGRQQNTALLDQLVKSIGADVPTAVDAVVRSAQQLERATQAVRLFERAVSNQERKLQAGSSTLLDVITQRDRLLSAQQTEVAARLSLALALAQLRFDTGTIFTAAADSTQSVDFNRLTSVPGSEEMTP